MPTTLLQPFGQDIWTVDGPTVTSLGFRYPTRMAILALGDGALLVWSPIAISDDLKAQVDAIGDVRFIVAPNTLHHLYVTDWQSAYPDAQVYAAPGLRKRRKDIAFDGELEDTPPAAWAEAIDQVVVRGNLITTEVVFFHRPSGTVLFTDLLQNFAPGWFSGWRAIVARLDLMVGGEPQVPRKFRTAFVNRTTARAALDRILAWPAQKVLMAHGDPVEEGAQAFLKRAFRWLTG